MFEVTQQLMNHTQKKEKEKRQKTMKKFPSIGARDQELKINKKKKSLFLFENAHLTLFIRVVYFPL